MSEQINYGVFAHAYIRNWLAKTCWLSGLTLELMSFFLLNKRQNILGHPDFLIFPMLNGKILWLFIILLVKMLWIYIAPFKVPRALYIGIIIHPILSNGMLLCSQSYPWVDWQRRGYQPSLLALLTTLSHTIHQASWFPKDHPSKYWPDPALFNFWELKGSDVHKAIFFVNYIHMAQSH